MELVVGTRSAALYCHMISIQAFAALWHVPAVRKCIELYRQTVLNSIPGCSTRIAALSIAEASSSSTQCVKRVRLTFRYGLVLDHKCEPITATIHLKIKFRCESLL